MASLFPPPAGGPLDRREGDHGPQRLFRERIPFGPLGISREGDHGPQRRFAERIPFGPLGISRIQLLFSTMISCVGTGSCSIWLMKAYGDVKSWSKKYTVDLEGGLGRILSFRKDGNILLTASDGELYSYDPNPRLQEIKYIGLLGTKDSFFVDHYTESLALLIEGEEELEGLPNAADSDSSEDGNGGEDDEVEESERWKQSMMVGFLTALLLEQ